MTTETKLHVFHDGEADWYVATCPEDAAGQQRALTGFRAEDQEWTFEALPDSEPLTIWCESATGKPGEIGSTDSVRISKTCGEWAATNGRGFLCSTEY